MELWLFCVVLLLGQTAPRPQAETQQSTATPAQVVAAIDKLADLNYPVRTDAARSVRRAAAAVAVPALTQAVASHKDSYVRFRALVLLSGFNDPGTRDVMTRVVADPNDRLRAVAYAYFEHHTDPAVLPRLIDALAREE